MKKCKMNWHKIGSVLQRNYNADQRFYLKMTGWIELGNRLARTHFLSDELDIFKWLYFHSSNRLFFIDLIRQKPHSYIRKCGERNKIKRNENKYEWECLLNTEIIESVIISFFFKRVAFLPRIANITHVCTRMTCVAMLIVIESFDYTHFFQPFCWHCAIFSNSTAVDINCYCTVHGKTCCHCILLLKPNFTWIPVSQAGCK